MPKKTDPVTETYRSHDLDVTTQLIVGRVKSGKVFVSIAGHEAYVEGADAEAYAKVAGRLNERNLLKRGAAFL